MEEIQKMRGYKFRGIIPIEESQKYSYKYNIFGILLLKFLVHDHARNQKPKIQHPSYIRQEKFRIHVV